MDLRTIIESLAHGPFQPFRIKLSDGTFYDVSNPDLVVPLRTKLMIAFPADDRFAVVSLLHITGIEALRQGRTRGSRPRRSA